MKTEPEPPTHVVCRPWAEGKEISIHLCRMAQRYGQCPGCGNAVPVKEKGFDLERLESREKRKHSYRKKAA